jgi:hypothetical protein
LALIRDDPFYLRHPRSITTCADSKIALNLSDHDRELQPPVQFQQKLRFSSQVCWRFIELMYRIWREHTKKRKLSRRPSGLGIWDSRRLSGVAEDSPPVAPN